MNTPRHNFIVRIRVEATVDATRRYMVDALRAYGGSRAPDDPFFALNPKHISVTPISKKKDV